MKEIATTVATVSVIVGTSGVHGGTRFSEVGQAFATELRTPKRARPVVAILADNRGAELTDCLVPHAALSRSGVADVILVAPTAGKIDLMPALAIKAQQTLGDFDREHSIGADYVIVPAMHHDDRTGPVVEWLRRQAALGATIIGICEGARVLGRAGLLDGRCATSHWYAQSDLRSAYPSMKWVADRRYVADDGVVTTTGVTASLPVSLALVEAIAGTPAAKKLADALGVENYGDMHDSSRYRLNASHVWRIVANSAAFWRHETIGIQVSEGVDSIALALTADAWARTYRSKVLALGGAACIKTRDGIDLMVDDHKGKTSSDLSMTLDPGLSAAAHLDRALEEISHRYGQDSAQLVALQLEFAWQPTLLSSVKS
ncbi:DJ-1/PfpI family protein [Variovorax sp. VaC1]|uniref:DJ-1/PfpI family protein n=1 Tax=Variovorax sp. VaC1 TaxID=3373132 RepID=UPI00374A0F7B